MEDFLCGEIISRDANSKCNNKSIGFVCKCGEIVRKCVEHSKKYTRLCTICGFTVCDKILSPGLFTIRCCGCKKCSSCGKEKPADLFTKCTFCDNHVCQDHKMSKFDDKPICNQHGGGKCSVKIGHEQGRLLGQHCTSRIIRLKNNKCSVPLTAYPQNQKRGCRDYACDMIRDHLKKTFSPRTYCTTFENYIRCHSHVQCCLFCGKYYPLFFPNKKASNMSNFIDICPRCCDKVLTLIDCIAFCRRNGTIRYMDKNIAIKILKFALLQLSCHEYRIPSLETKINNLVFDVSIYRDNESYKPA